MSPFAKGLIIAIIHVCLVTALGAKFLYDRTTLPKVWVKTTPYDPNLPIRGRYVSLQVIVEPRGIKETKQEPGGWQPAQPVILRVENERLYAEAKQQSTQHDSSGLQARYTKIGEESMAVLSEPVAFFIPDHVPDPSRRAPDEQLWVEVTVPQKGVPRPIRLGVKKDNGPIVPLNLN